MLYICDRSTRDLNKDEELLMFRFDNNIHNVAEGALDMA